MKREIPNIHFEFLIRELSAAGVRFVVAGGVAGVLHGIERATLDLDVALDFDTDNISKFADVIKHLGLVPLVPVAVKNLGNPQVVKMMVEEKHAIAYMLADPSMPLRKVDVFLTDELNYDTLYNNSIMIDLEGAHVRVVTLEKLLELKRAVQPPRDKDVLDINEIERLLAQRDKGTEQ